MLTVSDPHKIAENIITTEMFPIAETFVSPQGEGEHAGRLMQFIRMAGCTVGENFKPHEVTQEMGELHVYQKKCTLYDGRTFACDTNYQMAKKMTIIELVDMTIGNRVKHVCLTGGEPLMHKQIAKLIDALLVVARVYIETSGTIPIDNKELESALIASYVAISPKKGFRDEYMTIPQLTNEIKVLVDDKFKWYDLPEVIRHNPRKVFLQPVNYEMAVNRDNMQRVLELQRAYPSVRISTQMHKIWNVR